jgi:hypothetical protein
LIPYGNHGLLPNQMVIAMAHLVGTNLAKLMTIKNIEKSKQPPEINEFIPQASSLD